MRIIEVEAVISYKGGASNINPKPMIINIDHIAAVHAPNPHETRVLLKGLSDVKIIIKLPMGSVLSMIENV